MLDALDNTLRLLGLQGLRPYPVHISDGNAIGLLKGFGHGAVEIIDELKGTSF